MADDDCGGRWRWQVKDDVRFLVIGQVLWKEVGKALAETVKERIRMAGGRWNKTGKLLNSIESIDKKGGQLVVTVSDRLSRDETAEMFANEILTNLLDDEVQFEIAQAVFNAFKVT